MNNKLSIPGRLIQQSLSLSISYKTTYWLAAAFALIAVGWLVLAYRTGSTVHIVFTIAFAFLALLWVQRGAFGELIEKGQALPSSERQDRGGSSNI